MILDFLLIVIFLGLVALVAWALNKRTAALEQKPLDNVVPVFESPLVLPIENTPAEQTAEQPVEAVVIEQAESIAEQVIETPVPVETPAPKKRGGRPKKAEAAEAVAPVVEPVSTEAVPKKRVSRQKKSVPAA